MVRGDDLFDPAAGDAGPPTGSPTGQGASARAGDLESVFAEVLRETARVRTEIDWLVSAWDTAGRIVSRRLAEWAAAKDISAVGLVADLLFVFLLESPAIRETMSRILRGASGWLGKLILKRKAALAGIEDLSVAVATDIVGSSASFAPRLNAARQAEQAARTRLEDFAASVRSELPPPQGLRGDLPDRTFRFDLGAGRRPNRAQQRELLAQRHAEAEAELEAAMQAANAQLTRELARTLRQVDLAAAVQRAIGTPEAQERAVAAAKVAYKLADPTGYGALSREASVPGPPPPGRRRSIPIDEALVDAMHVLAIRLKAEMDALDRAAGELLRAGLRGESEQFALSWLSLTSLLLNLQVTSPAPGAKVGVATSLAAPGDDQVRNSVIKCAEEVLWAWLLYEPYFMPEGGAAASPMQSRQYDPLFVMHSASGSAWPPPDAALEYLHAEFVAAADDGYLEEAVDLLARLGRGVVDLELILATFGMTLMDPQRQALLGKTGREAAVIIHFRKLHDATLVPFLKRN